MPETTQNETEKYRATAEDVTKVIRACHELKHTLNEPPALVVPEGEDKADVRPNESSIVHFNAKRVLDAKGVDRAARDIIPGLPEKEEEWEVWESMCRNQLEGESLQVPVTFDSDTGNWLHVDLVVEDDQED